MWVELLLAPGMALKLSTEIGSRYYYPHFADEETKAQGIPKHSKIH